MLAELTGDYRMRVVVALYGKWALRHGYPARSAASLRGVAHRMRIPMAPTGAWLGVTALAAMISRDPSTVGTWARRGWVVRKDRAFNRRDIKRLARQRPWLFAGADHSGLMQLLQDERLVNRILQQHPKRTAGMRASQETVCLTTGERYRSQGEAARCCYVSRISVRRSISEGVTVCGLQFAAA